MEGDARLKILEQAQTFSATHTITLQGLCIHRKAINKKKTFCPACGSLIKTILRCTALQAEVWW